MSEITGSTVLPADREPVTLRTADGLTLVGELALPRRPAAGGHADLPAPAAHGGRDDGQPHPAQGRLPAARAGRPGGAAVQHPGHHVRARAPARAQFGDGEAERLRRRRRDRLRWPRACRGAGCSAGRSAPTGAEVGQRPGGRGRDPAVARRCAGPATPTWTAGRRRAARCSRWSRSSTTTCAPTRPGPGSPGCRRPRSSAVDGAKHLWVGEPYVRIVLNEIVRRVNPAAWPLPTAATAWTKGLTVSLVRPDRQEGVRHRRVPRDRPGHRGRARRGRAPTSRWSRAAQTAWPRPPRRSTRSAARRSSSRPTSPARRRSPPPSAAAIDQLGHVDIVVNNAGGSNFMVELPRPAAVRLGQADPAQPRLRGLRLPRVRRPTCSSGARAR